MNFVRPYLSTSDLVFIYCSCFIAFSILYFASNIFGEGGGGEGGEYSNALGVLRPRFEHKNSETDIKNDTIGCQSTSSFKNNFMA